MILNIKFLSRFLIKTFIFTKIIHAWYLAASGLPLSLLR